MHLFDWSFYGQLCNMTSCCEKWRGRWLYRPVGFLDIIRLVLSGHTYSVCVHDLSLTALVTLLFSFWFFCFVLLTFSVAGSMTWWYICLFFLSALSAGFGNISPHTEGGRIFCIVYALLGIPLFGFLLAGVGDQLGTIFGKGIARVEKMFVVSLEEHTQTRRVDIVYFRGKFAQGYGLRAASLYGLSWIIDINALSTIASPTPALDINKGRHLI